MPDDNFCNYVTEIDRMIIENKFSTIEIANQPLHLIHLSNTQLSVSKYANTNFLVKNQVCANYIWLKLINHSQSVCIAFLEKREYAPRSSFFIYFSLGCI